MNNDDNNKRVINPGFPMIDTVKTGQNLKMIMESRGLKVKDVQEYLGLAHPQGIYQWYTGHSLPTLDNLYALSELFHMPIDLLLCGNRKYMEYQLFCDIPEHIQKYCELMCVH